MPRHSVVALVAMTGLSLVSFASFASVVSLANAGQKVASHSKELARIRNVVAREFGCRDLSRTDAKAILGLRMPDAFESAGACIHAGGHAISVWVQISCGGDSCRAEGWLFSDVRPVWALPVENDYAISADGRHLFYTRLRPTKSLGTYVVDVARRDLATGVEKSFASCASPAISPGGAWLLCRNEANDVLRIPIDGGKPRLVAKGTGERTWTPYANYFPSAVAFPAASTMEVGMGGSVRYLTWRE